MKGAIMKKKRSLTLIYILLNIAIIVTLGLLDSELKDIGQLFYNIKPVWLLAALLSMGLFWFMDGLIIYYTSSIIAGTKRFLDSMKVAMIGQYYNAVTPFASGGQPVQIYYMGKYGIPGGAASSILLVKFLIYQVVLSLYCLAAFVYRGISIFNIAPLVFGLAIIGFIINFGSAIALLALAFNKGIVKKIVFNLLNFAHRIRIVKDLEKTKDMLMSHVEDFHRGFKIVRDNIKVILVMGIMTAIQFAGFFSVTYFIYRSFGLKGERWIDIVFVQALLYLAVSFVPTPGSSGASETGFMFFFQFFFPKGLIFMSMLLWRVITYYLGIILGGAIVLVKSIRNLITAPSVRNN